MSDTSLVVELGSDTIIDGEVGWLDDSATVILSLTAGLSTSEPDYEHIRIDPTERTHVYEAAYSEDETQRQLVSDLLDRAFGGSAAKLVLQALSERPATPEELTEIRQLLDKPRGRTGQMTMDPE